MRAVVEQSRKTNTGRATLKKEIHHLIYTNTHSAPWFQAEELLIITTPFIVRLGASGVEFIAV